MYKSHKHLSAKENGTLTWISNYHMSCALSERLVVSKQCHWKQKLLSKEIKSETVLCSTYITVTVQSHPTFRGAPKSTETSICAWNTWPMGTLLINSNTARKGDLHQCCGHLVHTEVNDLYGVVPCTAQQLTAICKGWQVQVKHNIMLLQGLCLLITVCIIVLFSLISNSLWTVCHLTLSTLHPTQCQAWLNSFVHLYPTQSWTQKPVLSNWFSKL